MTELYSGTELFNEVDRLHRQMTNMMGTFPSFLYGDHLGAFPSSIRSSRAGMFPQVNVGTTDDTIEIIVFAPGLNANAFDISIDKNLLSISGERKATHSAQHEEMRTYAKERFAGTFRRMIELPQNVDPTSAQARYNNGCLLISLAKREASKPRSITVQ